MKDELGVYESVKNGTIVANMQLAQKEIDASVLVVKFILYQFVHSLNTVTICLRSPRF